MRILDVCPRLPVPTDSGGSIRVFSLIKGLSQTEEVDILGIEFEKIRDNDLAQLKGHCRKIFFAPWKYKPKLLQMGAIFKRVLTGEPFETKYTDSEELRRLLYKVTSEEDYDIIIIEHSVNARFLFSLYPQHGAKTVLSTHNTGFMQYYRMYQFERKLYKKLKLLLTWLPMRSWEPKIAARFDKIVSVSESDKNLLLSRNPNLDIAVVPNGVDTRTYRPFPLESREKNILLIGSMDYKPNVDAALFFCREIFPLMKKSHPACTLTIIGKTPPVEIRRLNEEPGVEFKGDVDDVRPYYQKALVSVVPLRSGGGTRLKILEAMALGTPAVSTSIGCEGLHVENNRNILIADNPADFAQQITNLITDVELWNRISRNGRTLVEGNYDWGKISSEYRAMLEELDQRP
jgi:glycosyltransferase involved in cell wall biosynthesis